jgi:hypothetical protein
VASDEVVSDTELKISRTGYCGPPGATCRSYYSWSLEIGRTGRASFASDGDPSLADGRYEGTVPAEIVARIRLELERYRSSLKALEWESCHIHSRPDFTVWQARPYFQHSTCWAYDSDLEKSELGEVYCAAVEAIRLTSWNAVTSHG